MQQLVNHAIPNQSFIQDVIDQADEVRNYRNHLVHDIEDSPEESMVTISVEEAKRGLCAYLGRLAPRWK